GATRGARAVDYLDALIARLPGATAVARTAAAPDPTDPPGPPTPTTPEIPPIGTPFPTTIELSDEFLANRPLLYQLLDAAIELVPDGQTSAYRPALTTLRDLDVATLELRLRETLGLAS